MPPDASPSQVATPGAPLLIAAAAEVEVSALRRALATTARTNPRIVVEVAGVGRPSESTFADCLARLAPNMAINLGVAGSLAPGVAAGDLVLVTNWAAFEAPAGDAPASSEAALEWLRGALHRARLEFVEGTAITVDRPSHDPAWRDRTHARSGAIAVEMEGAHWCRRAAAAGVPFAALRVISDRADLALPRPRHLLLTGTGQVRWGAWWTAVREAGTSPARELPRLLRARRDWRRALGTLEAASRALATTANPGG